MSDEIVNWKRGDIRTAEKRSGSLEIISEYSRRNLKKVLKKIARLLLLKSLSSFKI